MPERKVTRFLVGLLSLALWSAHAWAGNDEWESYTNLGYKASQDGNYAAAENWFTAALREAKGFGPEDPRLARSLNNMARLYYVEDRHDKAAPL
jgi:tetratricopeptide (TPR) repeat protein